MQFRQKKFGYVDSMISGAVGGASIGGAVGGIVKNDVLAKYLGLVPGHQGYGWGQRAAAATITGAIVGASLGILAEGIKGIAGKINKSKTLDNRLMKLVVENLTKLGYKEGIDFTRDPKEASDGRLKVCISIARVNGDLKILVNAIKDPKLRDVSNALISKIPKSSRVRQDMKDKFNEISITSISDASSDLGLVVGIAESFIKNGYPVYLVEVG